MLALTKLAVDAADKPVQEVPFPATIGPPTSRDPGRRSAADGAPVPAPDRRRGAGHDGHAAPRGAPARRRAPPGLAPAAAPKSLDAPFGFLYPTRRRSGAVYDSARAYTIKDAQGTRHAAYRLSIRAGLGEYYGVQGTDWTDPPILAAPDEQRTLGDRTFDLYYDGRHLRRVALRTSEGSWWVTNTLTLGLTNAQMLAIARSLRAA